MATPQPFKEAWPIYGPIGLRPAASIAGLPEPRVWERGHRLTLQGTPVDQLYWIESGVIKKVSFRSNGQELIIGMRTSGWMVGGAAHLSGVLAESTTLTLTECLLRPISRRQFECLYLEHVEFTRHVGLMLASELAIRLRLNTEIRHRSARLRLEQLLLECTTSFAASYPENPPLRLKQIEVAQILSITPEHLSRILTQMEDEGSPMRQNARLLFGTHQS